MERIHIIGGNRLKGSIKIAGSKNAALPLLAAGLLSDKNLKLTNLPDLEDIKTMLKLLGELGLEVNQQSDFTAVKASKILSHRADYDLVRKMRASFLTLGPLLAREGFGEVSLPGGCAIGTRPIDIHLLAFQSLGASIDVIDGYVKAKSPRDGLRGNKIIFPKVSVGATENAIMAACLAKGQSVLLNAAKEPEISDLCNCLNSMGAKISGIGSSNIEIEGVNSFNNATHRVMPDRIETGTYMIATIITKGEVLLTNTEPDLLRYFITLLKESGLQLEEKKDSIYMKVNNNMKSVNVSTREYPGFPTDMQAQLMVLACLAEGKSFIKESIFENRFMHVPELNRLGAEIKVEGNCAEINGDKNFIGAQVMATDLRASVSLVLAGLVAKGETIINRIYHLDRGYERIEDKLSSCGANIKRKDYE